MVWKEFIDSTASSTKLLNFWYDIYGWAGGMYRCFTTEDPSFDLNKS